MKKISWLGTLRCRAGRGHVRNGRADSGALPSVFVPGLFVSVLGLSVLGLAGCTGLQTDPSSAEVPALRSLPIVAVAATQLPDYWQWLEAPVAEKPIRRSRDQQLGCVALHFGIDSQGHLFDLQARRSWPQGEFVEQALAMAATWQFEPVPGNPIRQPVRTTWVLTLQSMAGELRVVDAEHVAQRCRQ